MRPQSGDAATILVADDDPSILNMLELKLTKLGYQVVTARDGEEALSRARQIYPDLILLDVMMPNMSGWEVARALRHDDEPALSSVKIVMVTAIGAGLSEMTAPLYEVDAHVDKPFEFRALEETISDLLGA